MPIEPTPATLGGLLLHLRTRAGLTQREVGDLLGVNDATVGHWEAGRRAPREVLSKLLDALGASDAEKLTAIALPRHVDVSPDASDTFTSVASRPSQVITATPPVPKLSADDEHTAPTTDPPSSVVLSSVCLACSGRGQVAGDDCDACDCTGRVLLISGDEAVDAA